MRKLNFIVVFILLLTSRNYSQLQQAFAISQFPYLIHDVGAAYVNIASFNWRMIQNNTNSAFNWNSLDQAIQGYQSKGIDIYFTIQCVSPVRANQTPCAIAFSNSKGIYQSWFPEDTVKWKNFISALVDRYDGNGNNDMPGLLRPINHWHIEQEWERIWCSQYSDTSLAFVHEFTRYVNMTYNEIKKQQLNSKISFAGIDTRHDMEVYYDGYYSNQGNFCISSNCATHDEITHAQLASNDNFLKNYRNVLYLMQNAKFDELDIHQYGRWETIPDIVRWVKDHVLLGNRVIIFLEGGGPFCKACEPIYHSASDTTGYLPPELVRDNSSYVVYYFITGIANGIKRLHWHLGPEYSVWGATWGDLDLLSKNYAKKPSYYIYRFLANLMKSSDADTVFRVSTSKSSLYYYRINPLGTSVVWSTQQKDSLTISGSGELFLTHIPTVMGDSLIRVDTLNLQSNTKIILSERVPVFLSGNNFIISNIESENEIIPAQYKLYQNYPNPFNPSTTIRFSLPNRSHITLKIFDVLGREVTTLVDRELSAGEHSVVFDFSNLSSGVYIYRLQAARFVQQKKMAVIR